MNGITYYRLKSDYTGDYTKNCALNGSEVDNNFYVLESRDVKSIAVKDRDIVVTLMNGDTMTAQISLDDMSTSVVAVEFDKLNGVLSLTKTDGTIQKIEGFATNENTDFSVSTDNTLCGEGLRHAPLGVAPAYRTGQYKTAKAIINVTEGGTLPECGMVMGDRYVTCEDVSDYGYLYDYNAVKEIACELQKSGWRIPTKEDWDNMLNAIEPCDCDKTHDKGDKNKFLGKWAGKLLKSKTMWKNGCCDDSCGGCDCDGCSKKKPCGCDSDCDCGTDTCFDYSDNPCISTKESESECKCEEECGNEKHRGLDAYGFRATPTGYADDGCNIGYFRERTAFWTATTNTDNTKAYIKRFQYNKDGVYQDVIASNYHLSLRLVKDYDGKNYFDVENIMDLDYPTLLLPSVAKGRMIWTACNFACGNASLNPMLPNNGQGLTYTRHYFINEWDGFRWVRNEIKQGESVVISKDTNNKTMVEYRVVGNEFVSVNEMIYKDVLTDITKIIEKETEDRTADIKHLQEQIDEEIENRENGDELVMIAVNDEAEERKKTDDKLQLEIETEILDRAAADEEIKTSISDEIQNRTDADNKLQEAINQEITDRESGDELITKVLEDETTERKAEDEKLQSAIEQEILDRALADEELDDKINTEAATREEEDNKLSDALNSEAERATAKENELSDRIDSVSSEVGDVKETVATVNQNLVDSINKINENVSDAINTINQNVADAINTINGGIATEIEERKKSDEEIAGKLLSPEGTEFNSETGVLTLKSVDGTNDKEVQFSFNFGEF